MTIEAPLVFLDTETTGLDLTDDIWEFSAIRRDPSGIETGCGMFIEHSAEKAARLPERFRADLERRYNPPFVLTQEDAAREIARFLAPSPSGQKAHIVGAVPNFDTERIALLLARFGHKPEWHHHLIDVGDPHCHGERLPLDLHGERRLAREVHHHAGRDLVCGVPLAVVHQHTPQPASGDAPLTRPTHLLHA